MIITQNCKNNSHHHVVFLYAPKKYPGSMRSLEQKKFCGSVWCFSFVVSFLSSFLLLKSTQDKAEWNGRRCEMWRMTCSSASLLRFLHWKSNDAWVECKNLSVSEHQMTTSCFLIRLIIYPSFISCCREFFFVFCSFEWLSLAIIIFSLLLFLTMCCSRSHLKIILNVIIAHT